MTLKKSLAYFLHKVLLFVWHLHHRLFISIVVLLAFVLISLRLSTFYLESNPQIIQDYLESELQHAVTFDKLYVNISPIYPSLSVNNFIIKDSTGRKTLLSFSSVNIQLDIISSIIRKEIVVNELSLNGSEILIQREPDSSISIAGIKLDSTENMSHVDADNSDQLLLQLLAQKRLIINNSKLLIVDKMNEYSSAALTNIHIDIKNSGIKHQIEVQTKLDKVATQLELRMDLIGRLEDPKSLSGRMYGLINKLTHETLQHFIKEDKVQLENYQLDNLKANIKIWSEIRKGQFQSATGRLSVNESEIMHIDNKQNINIYDLKTNFRFAFDTIQKYSASEQLSLLKKNWSADLYELAFSVAEEDSSGQRIHISHIKDENEQNSQIKIFINKLELEKLSPFTNFFLSLQIPAQDSSSQDNMGQIFQAADPGGEISNLLLSLSISDKPGWELLNYQLQADLSDISIKPSASTPAIMNLSAQLILNKERGQVLIDSQNMDLHIHSLFRDAWPVNQLKGEVYWQKEDGDWLLGINNIFFDNPHLNADADLKLWLLEDNQLFIDLSAFFRDADVKQVPLYLPSKVMSDGLVDWLDNAFDSGRATDGGVLFRGQLSHFPFQDKSGVLDISFNTKEVLLDYQKDWPKIKNINALVQFTEKGMLVRSQQSEIFSADSNNIHAHIDDYLKSVLTIKGDVRTPIKDSLHYLQQSNLLSKDVLDMLDAEGNLDLNLDLVIPMEEGKSDTRILISLNDVDYYPPGFERKKGLVSHVKGKVLLHNGHLDAKNLTASIMNFPAELSIKSEKKLTKKNQEPYISVAVASNITIKQLEKYNVFPEKFKPIKNYLSGGSRVFLDVNLPNEEQTFSFHIKSNFKGLSSDLPAPFTKQKEEKSPFNLHYVEIPVSSHFKNTLQSVTKSSAKQSYLNINYSDKLSLALLLSTSKKEFDLLRGNIVFAAEQAKLPEQNILKISGSISETPIDEWGMVLESLQQKKLSEPVKQKKIAPIELAMTELVLPELNFLNSDLESELESEQKNSKIWKPESISKMEPGQFSLINGTIQSLKLGSVELGKLTIQSSRVDEDMLFDVLRLEGEHMSFEGRADWHHWYAEPEVNLEGVIKVPSMETLFRELSMNQIMSNGKGEFSGFISWKGAPTDISKKNIKGNIKINVQDGNFIDADQGAAGHLLGLLNLNALVRRISYDSKNVSGKGFAFEKINGDFRLLNGSAYTENLHIFSPSADLLILGRTGMVAKDLDQQVIVIPEISATLPLAGAAVAGPAGVAIGWVGQKLIGKELNKISAFNYSVTGSWQNPVIERQKNNRVSAENFNKLFNFKHEKTSAETEKNQSDENNNPLFESTD
ncbi:MAG: hypothetical protein KZQ83_11840 [gamma proteobacterium symbiont of Taylorina sp.]|nr:hypothetical protein [gamma proteobacterium symbiont of Taylorina sp.]